MNEPLRNALATVLDCAVVHAVPVAGGDINQAYSVRLSDDRELFVKTNDNAPATMFECEARGLAWLGECNALRVPDVIAVSSADDHCHYLVLEMLTPGRRAPDFDERLGRGLATLHRSGADHFGLDYHNFIATLPQNNDSCASWADFYALRRLEPQVKRAVDHRVAPRAWVRQLDRLITRLPELVGPAEPPSRLHGDLWSGNVHVGPDGSPCLIDPAVYAGHREMDLAMLALFGGLSDATEHAYDETWPRAPEWRDRVPLYQLYPLLTHVNLFGSSYVSAVEDKLKRFV